MKLYVLVSEDKLAREFKRAWFPQDLGKQSTSSRLSTSIRFPVAAAWLLSSVWYRVKLELELGYVIPS